MNLGIKTLALIAGLVFSIGATAELAATTEDGRKVVLRANGTWSFAGDVAASKTPIATLTVLRRESVTNGCIIGLELENNLNDLIRTLVLRFTAYRGPDVRFDTVSRGYSHVRPTLTSYEEVQFRGITCEDITSVEVSAARNCSVGELTKYSSDPGDCLALFEIAPTDMLAITKTKLLD
jgi:hypothetical protein